MRKFPFVFSALLLLAAFASAQVPQSGHVVMVVEENHSYGSVIGSSSMPYLNSLAQKYGLATNYYANTHPSIGNYFMLTTGQIITNSDGYTGTVTANNMVRAMLTAGVSWKAYAESIPSVGYVGGDSYPYVKHHNPFAYFSDVRNSSTEKNNIVGFGQFATDRTNSNLPQFSMLIPNMRHNMHDCPTSASCTDADKKAAADSWLKTNLAPLLADPEFQKDGLLVITWDESASTDTAHGGGRVATLVIGPKVKAGYKSTTLYQHQSLLRTILASMGITSGLPGASASAPLMSDIFATTTSDTASSTSCSIPSSGPSINICSPTGTSSSPMRVAAAAKSTVSVNYMAVWVDGTKAYQANTNSIDTTVPVSDGTHRITVQAKDTNGNLFQKTVYTTVSTTSSGCTAGTTGPSINICSPSSTSSSPIQVSAAAVSNSAVNYMAVWMDGVKQYENNSSSISTTFSASAGSHRITVQAKDSSGYLFAKTVYTTVSTSGTQTWTISGTVTSSGAGAKVALSGAASSTANADSKGNFQFAGLANGTYTITPTLSGYTFTPSSQAVTVNGSNVTSVNFSTASSPTQTSHSVDLSWKASTTSTVVGYNVYRSTVSGGSYAKINSNTVASTGYTDTGVSSGKSYYYVVKAVDKTGAESSASNQATAVIPTP